MHPSIHPSMNVLIYIRMDSQARVCMPHAPHMYRRMHTCFGKTHCLCMQKHHRHHTTQTGPVLSRSKWAPPADVPQRQYAECFIRCVQCSVEIVEHFFSLPQSLMSQLQQLKVITKATHIRCIFSCPGRGLCVRPTIRQRRTLSNM